MLDINDTKMKYEDNPENKNHATCTCEPLDRGYGTTIGSSLKRILLSSIQGAAVVAVRFNGADSMEDQLEGVKDSIQDIVLRLRELSIKPVEAPIKAVVNVEAGAEDTQVTVADITCEDQEQELEILEPETCLATVKAGGKLEMELYIESGYGYVSAEKNISAPEGTIALDCVYSPLRRVEYKVQNTRVGNTTDYDRLIVELETDGTISAADALRESASLRIQMLLFLSGRFTLQSDIQRLSISRFDCRAPAAIALHWQIPNNSPELLIRCEFVVSSFLPSTVHVQLEAVRM